jgi:hypothetical protein
LKGAKSYPRNGKYKLIKMRNDIFSANVPAAPDTGEPLLPLFYFLKLTCVVVAVVVAALWVSNLIRIPWLPKFTPAHPLKILVIIIK